MLTIEILDNELTPSRNTRQLRGFNYWWLKKVRGFNDSVHCARCLVGTYSEDVSKTMPSGVPTPIAIAQEADVFYLCGVAAPSRYVNNFHAALRVAAGAPVFDLPLHTGQTVRISGAIRLLFDDKAARRDYAGLSERFLSCRNFQFGAQHFNAGTGPE